MGPARFHCATLLKAPGGVESTTLEKSENVTITERLLNFQCNESFLYFYTFCLLTSNRKKNYACISSKKLISAYDPGPAFFKALLRMSGSRRP